MAEELWLSILNPLTSFIIEVLASPFDEQGFRAAFRAIADSIENDPVYVEHYLRETPSGTCTVYNYRWDGGAVAKVAVEDEEGERELLRADDTDREKARSMLTLDIPFWFPTDTFPETPSIRHKFISDAGGNGFQYLWTRRNLYLLARIFSEIGHVSDAAVQRQLLFGFVQTLHLTCKMVVPRNTASKRDFSGSWGRADYMIRRRSMEQNPLVVFRRSCVEKQGVISAMRDARQTLPPSLSIADVRENRAVRPSASINYGAVDVADLTRYLEDKSIDFVITDPPYAGLVYYLDLSLLWLVWLQHLDEKYRPDLRSEITIKTGQVGRPEYRRRLAHAFKQIHRVLKDDGRLVVTFHHKKMQEWNDFVRSVKLAGFKFDKVTHQYNRRSGESNVANPYGTSGADFYIRCVKHRDVDFTDDTSDLRHFIVLKAIEIIALRAEPTPYTFIVAGLVPEMLQAGFVKPEDYQAEIQSVLSAAGGDDKVFVHYTNGDNKAGDTGGSRAQSSTSTALIGLCRTGWRRTVLSLLRRRVAVRLDDVLAELFRTYPNGLTPDPKGIKAVLEKYAYRSADRWKIRDTTLLAVSKHTELLRQIAEIGHRAGAAVYIGKREQWEGCRDGQALGDLADMRELACLREVYSAEQLQRIQMIDELWLDEASDIIRCAFEVESTTGFMSAIQRASNLPPTVPKFMVIPVEREAELIAMRDPLFRAAFAENSWRYVTSTAVVRLHGFSQPSLQEMCKMSKELP